ncbi:MAG: four helix bundle protein [Patescibacteria group bacterium]
MATGLENLKIYQMAEELELMLHKVTGKFPNNERFRSVDQIKISLAAVANNISEGYTRHSYKKKVRYLYIAKGEAEETKRNIIRSFKKGFLEKKIAEEITDKYTELLKAISGYIKFLKSKDINL